MPQKRAGTHITTNGTRAVTFRKNAFQMRIEFMKYSQVDSYRARYKQMKCLPCCSRNAKFASQVVSLPTLLWQDESETSKELARTSFFNRRERVSFNLGEISLHCGTIFCFFQKRNLSARCRISKDVRCFKSYRGLFHSMVYLLCSLN